MNDKNMSLKASIKQAEKIIKSAKMKGGTVMYNDVSNLFDGFNAKSINSVLGGYGKITMPLTNGSWYSFELNNESRKNISRTGVFWKSALGTILKIIIGVITAVIAYIITQYYFQ